MPGGGPGRASDASRSARGTPLAGCRYTGVVTARAQPDHSARAGRDLMANDFRVLPADLRGLPSLFDLSGKAALVTGAASGLGRAIAVGLAVNGADVVTADVNVDGAEATSAVIRDLGRRTATIAVD